MKNQKSIQILSGTREKILKNKYEKLLKGQPLYNLTDNTLSIGDENSNIDKLPIATNELHGNMDGIKSTNAQGVYDYSISYVDNKGISIKNNVKYDGESIIFSDGSIGTQKGDIIPGAEATGIQSMAFGGLRYDYFNPEENNWGKTPTSAEGNQSFAAGGSVHAHGDWSAAFGKDNDAYQRGGFVTGNGCRVGMTEEEFNEKYSVAVGSVTVPKYITIFTDTPSNNTNTENASVVYQYTAYTNNYNTFMASNNITSENIELEESATKTERFIYKKSTILGADSLTVPEYFAALRENVSLKAGNYTGKHKCSDYEGKWYISYSFATAFGDKNKVEGRAQFASGVGLIANGIDGAAYVGKYNATSLNSYSLFTVGGGSSDSDRKSLLTVLKDGRLRLPNIIETLTDNDVTRLKDVKNLITEATIDFEALDSDFFNSIY